MMAWVQQGRKKFESDRDRSVAFLGGGAPWLHWFVRHLPVMENPFVAGSRGVNRALVESQWDELDGLESALI